MSLPLTNDSLIDADSELAKLSLQNTQLGGFLTAAETFLYGTYVILFGFYMRLLLKGAIRRNRFLNFSTIALFGLSTIHLALVLALTAVDNQVTVAVFQLDAGSSSVAAW
ncbi:hypothetical protein FB45DRAFT_1021469 [Roridomyces roridus]|uniref:Uncharacterized protein n=1 Tax=Roridomyces roridus TaxID=1738132 RepID=A0AAD7CCN5_9AGAR|nr:hypothetical protein FB45DRAFT_1021469 [Roridomyces roridus]